MWDTGLVSARARRVNPYATLNPHQLKSEIEKTEYKLSLLRETLADYGDNPIQLWECAECGNRFVDGDDCVQHLIDVHNYPDDDKREDANLSTRRVWARR